MLNYLIHPNISLPIFIDRWLELRNKPESELTEWQYVERHEVPDGFLHPERHTLGNMIPACSSCNINKHDETIEGFRDLIAGFMKYLNEKNTQYKIAKRYGLVTEDIKPVVFYFETFTRAKIV